MELNGALSNPFVTDKSLLIRLRRLNAALLVKGAAEPRPPRQTPWKRDPVLETVTEVLRRANRPLRVIEVRIAAEALLRRPLNASSVNAALSANAAGQQPRFRRVAYGRYRLA